MFLNDLNPQDIRYIVFIWGLFASIFSIEVRMNHMRRQTSQGFVSKDMCSYDLKMKEKSSMIVYIV